MTHEQFNEVAVKIFNECGPYQNRKALDLIYEAVTAPDSIYHHYTRQTVESLAWLVYPVPAFLADTVNKLSSLIGKNATIVQFSGYCTSIHVKIEKISVRNYAQYNNLVYITYREKRKRTSYAIGIQPNTTIAIYSGHIDVNTETQVVETDNGYFTSKNYGLSFDPAHFTGAIASVQDTPVFIQRKDD